jgi:hypothetical protein
VTDAPLVTGPLDRQGADDEAGPEGLWPSPAYSRQIERLRAAIGETIFLAELNDSAVQLGVRLTDTPFVLLALIDFPRPDPSRGLAPHLVLLDDGRGVNLGRIARISRHRAFSPQPADILYQDSAAQRSRAVLGQVLGRSGDLPPERLTDMKDRQNTGERS